MLFVGLFVVMWNMSLFGVFERLIWLLVMRLFVFVISGVSRVILVVNVLVNSFNILNFFIFWVVLGLFVFCSGFFSVCYLG